jgi:hypothetical protein
MKPQACELCGEGKCKCEKDFRVYFCPKCNSHNIKYVFELRNIFGVIPKQRCLSCGFEAPSFPVWITNKKKIHEAALKIKKTKKKTKTKKIRRKK